MVSESRNIAEKQFADLYSKYVAGGRWLDAQIAAGKNVRADTDAYIANVIIPLRDLYLSFDVTARHAADCAMMVAEKFGGQQLKFVEF